MVDFDDHDVEFFHLTILGNDADTTTEKVLQKQRDFKKSLSNLSEQIDSMNETILELKTALEKLAPKKKEHVPKLRNTLNIKL